MTDRRAKRWFDTVRDANEDFDDKDKRGKFIDTVLDAADYYLTVTNDVPEELLIVGRLEGLLIENTGLAYFYNSIHTDALQVRKYLENESDAYEYKKYVWFQTTADGKAMLGTKPTATDLRKHIKADDNIQIMHDCIRLIADRQHMLEDIRDAFATRGYNLKTITDLRIAKLEEVWIDGTRETDNN